MFGGAARHGEWAPRPPARGRLRARPAHADPHGFRAQEIEIFFEFWSVESSFVGLPDRSGKGFPGLFTNAEYQDEWFGNWATYQLCKISVWIISLTLMTEVVVIIQ